MPPVDKKLDVNIKVSVSKRFIIDITVKAILLREHDWNEPKLSFQGKTIARSEELKKLTDEKTFKSSDGSLVTIKRPEVVDEYERHKNSVDTANNLRDNLTFYHDIISAERWKMHFFGFYLGLCEANAYSSIRAFSEKAPQGVTRPLRIIWPSICLNIVRN
ncbi:hypothetical protein CU097_013024 [Rhizopus azygosporus]|uniref:PiggyBac transposable element-derived protein domain-containing protein n=1 Tax=Rhizopus azygosporus TaxID=86630 RepID=A0A367JYQ0_RHIAZ|nr:hypothetical protein CU097_013024 [Rhizopus azygosporus]